MTETIDDKINELFKKLNDKKAELETTKKDIDRRWLTNCSFGLDATYSINLQTLNENAVLHLAARVLERHEYLVKAASVVAPDIKQNDLKVENYHVEDWLKDCKKRLAMLQLKSRKEKVEELEVRLNSIISPEQRRQLELEAITKELNT